MKHSEIKIQDIIDASLTPKNAAAKGYVYVEDIYNPCPALQEIIELVESKGFKFGAPDKKQNECVLGLYKTANLVKNK